MAKSKEISVEQRLRALYDLQLIDSRIDEIRNVRGELPLEVSDLEDEVAGLNKRLEKLEENLAATDTQISDKKNLIEEAKTLIKKYSEQQKNVRNNREFNSITKEVEYQELEIELAEKHIREFRAQIEQKKFKKTLTLSGKVLRVLTSFVPGLIRFIYKLNLKKIELSSK